MAYSSAVIANYFIKKAHESHQEISPLKLVKLVYFAHGWSLGLKKEPLINEQVEAWQYGPVINSLYHQFKRFGNEDINEYAPTCEEEAIRLDQDKITLVILDRVWEVYGKYSAIQLANLTHEENTPWHIAWHRQEGKNGLNFKINNDLIKEHFIQQAEIN